MKKYKNLYVKDEKKKGLLRFILIRTEASILQMPRHMADPSNSHLFLRVSVSSLPAAWGSAI